MKIIAGICAVIVFGLSNLVFTFLFKVIAVFAINSFGILSTPRNVANIDSFVNLGALVLAVYAGYWVFQQMTKKKK